MNSLEKTATEARIDELGAQRTYALLQTRLQYQAEIIAKHYKAHAIIASHLDRLIEERRESGRNDVLERAIEMMVDQIKADHLQDFGIPLEWKAIVQKDLPAGFA